MDLPEVTGYKAAYSNVNTGAETFGERLARTATTGKATCELALSDQPCCLDDISITRDGPITTMVEAPVVAGCPDSTQVSDVMYAVGSANTGAHMVVIPTHTSAEAQAA
jgi:hypothetical protein